MATQQNANYDLKHSDVVLTWKILLDYDPNSSSLEDAVGEHYTIYKTQEGQYLIHCRHRLRDSFMGDVYDGPEYMYPISREMVCLYAFLYNHGDVIEREGLELERKRLVDRVLASVTGENKKVIQVKKEIYLGLDDLRAQIGNSSLAFRDDIEHDLIELQQCLAVGAYRAALAISGRLLEVCLKLYCLQKSIEFSDKWMVGQLIDAISRSGYYLDPSVKGVWQVINQQRIIGVHAKEQAPVPSKEQAFMVGFAVIEVVKHLLKESA